jgi:hypothetical protein
MVDFKKISSFILPFGVISLAVIMIIASAMVFSSIINQGEHDWVAGAYPINATIISYNSDNVGKFLYITINYNIRIYYYVDSIRTYNDNLQYLKNAYPVGSIMTVNYNPIANPKVKLIIPNEDVIINPKAWTILLVCFFVVVIWGFCDRLAAYQELTKGISRN